MDTFLIDFCNSAYDTFVWLQLRYLLYSVHNVVQSRSFRSHCNDFATCDQTNHCRCFASSQLTDLNQDVKIWGHPGRMMACTPPLQSTYAQLLQ